MSALMESIVLAFASVAIPVCCIGVIVCVFGMVRVKLCGAAIRAIIVAASDTNIAEVGGATTIAEVELAEQRAAARWAIVHGCPLYNLPARVVLNPLVNIERVKAATLRQIEGITA